MATLRFKKDGTPYVDFRAQGLRCRPEFTSLKDAKKFLPLADANPVEAYRLWQESIADVPGALAPSESISFKEKLESFKEDYCTKRMNRNDMSRIMSQLFDFVIERATLKNGFKVDDLDIKAVDLDYYTGFQSHLIKTGISNSSVNRYLSTVKTFVKRMYKAGYIPVNYAALMESLPVETVKREAWKDGDTPKLIAKLIEMNGDPVLVDIARSMEFTPFGPTDFARLKWTMVRFDLGEIAIFRMKGRGRRDWNVPMILGYQKLLLEIRKRHEVAGFAQPNDHVYATTEFKPVKPVWVSKSLERARKAAGISTVPYSSRHRIISLLANKTDRDTASKFAGHTSLRTTEKHYLVGGDEDFRKKVKEAFAE